MNPEPVTVAVIVVNFNAGCFLWPCLEALEEQTSPADRIILVDNGSTDGSMEGVGARFPGVEIQTLPENTGFAGANNSAMALVEDCQWVALLNPDTRAAPDWLARLRSAVQRNAGVSMFSSRLVDAYNPGRLDGTGDCYHVSGLVWRRDHGAPASRRRGESEVIFSPCAAAGMYRLELVRKAGGFDERYFCYNEDIDLAFRMRLLGARCMHVDDSIVAHAGSGITGAHSDFTVYHGHRNLVWTYIKNMPGRLFWRYLPLHLLMNLVSIIHYTLRGRPGVILRAKRDALRGLGEMLASRREVQGRFRGYSPDIRAAMITRPLAFFHRHD
jgi:GT2 family glycosyltransferase